uniref:Uncharacterized protein n=1 Tax=Alexandrium catenella TaxID=2925 RepID=A0A7S1RGN7_ALECA
MQLVALALLSSSRQAFGQFLDGLSKLNPDKIAHSLGDVNPSKVAEALQDAKIPQSVRAITPEKAVKAIESASTAKVADVVAVLKDTSVKNATKAVGDSLQEAAHRLNTTHPGRVGETIRETHQRTQDLAEALRQSLPKDVVHELQHADPKKVEKAIETVDWWSTHWQWVFLAFCLLTFSCVGIWYVYRTLWSSPRSPTLLVDSEINMWVRPGGGRQWEPPSAEEQCFRQF